MRILQASTYPLLPLLILLAAGNEARGVEAMKNGTASVNGTSLYYEVRGKGFPLVFISGGGLLDRRGWDDQFETFAKYYKVIRYDIRGIGKSARPQGPFSHSRDLHALLRFLQVKKAHVVGLSFGGGLAIDFALDHPEMVDHLILAASGTSSDAKGEANLQSISALASLVKAEGLPQATELILDSGFFLSKENAAARKKVRQIYLDNRDVFEADFPLVRFWQPTEPPASERLSEIRAPVLVLMAENDNPAYKAMVEKVARGINGAKMVLIAGAGHAINLDKPKEFNQALLEFLGKR